MRIKRVTSDLGQKIASIAIWMLGVGVILAIWGGVWLVYLYRNPADTETLYFVATGILLSGLDLVAIGLMSGPIGRAARETSADDKKEPERLAVATPDCDDRPER